MSEGMGSPHSGRNQARLLDWGSGDRVCLIYRYVLVSCSSGNSCSWQGERTLSLGRFKHQASHDDCSQDHCEEREWNSAPQKLGVLSQGYGLRQTWGRK